LFLADKLVLHCQLLVDLFASQTEDLLDLDLTTPDPSKQEVLFLDLADKLLVLPCHKLAEDNVCAILAEDPSDLDPPTLLAYNKEESLLFLALEHKPLSQPELNVCVILTEELSDLDPATQPAYNNVELPLFLALVHKPLAPLAQLFFLSLELN
jgi:hypothetical protein